MSDPRYTDPRLSDQPVSADERRRRMQELENSNAVWGWIAGGIVMALLLVFVFGRGPNTPTNPRSSEPAPNITSPGPIPRN